MLQVVFVTNKANIIRTANYPKNFGLNFPKLFSLPVKLQIFCICVYLVMSYFIIFLFVYSLNFVYSMYFLFLWWMYHTNKDCPWTMSRWPFLYSRLIIILLISRVLNHKSTPLVKMNQRTARNKIRVKKFTTLCEQSRSRIYKHNEMHTYMY